jgi:redox-sensitive bicupin YhaK (pirin superfamily)
MSKQLPRRSFVKRLSLAVASAFVVPSVLSNEKKNKEPNDDENMNPIKSIKPLGFQWETQDPFLFCVHHEDAFPKGNDVMGPDESFLKGRHMGDDFIIKDGFRMYHGQTVPGFPGHPHRGFETITVVRKGLVDHADSLGAAGRYGNGDVQWMTAGKGVQHSEMFPLLKKDEENPMELFQIWLNLPKKNKMVEPHFKMLWRDAIPNEAFTDANSKKTNIEIIAGKLGEKKAQTPPPDSWAADETHEVMILNIKMEAGATWNLPAASKGINRTLYFYEGDTLTLDEQSVAGYHAIEVLPEMELTLTAGEIDASILVLQGKPIGEVVMQYGPFVMNTKEEIKQAFEDYHATKFGGWPWPKYDQVHDREKTRFARHADGTEEVKEG